MDIAFRDEPPPVRHASRAASGRSKPSESWRGPTLVRKASIGPLECAERPSDGPVSLGPDRTIPRPLDSGGAER